MRSILNIWLISTCLGVVEICYVQSCSYAKKCTNVWAVQSIFLANVLILESIAINEGSEISKEVLRTNKVSPIITENSANCPANIEGKSVYKGLFQDPHFDDQWILQDCRNNRDQPKNDLNVVPVWYKYKFFGKGIFVIISDGLIDWNHPDLVDNYDHSLSKTLFDERLNLRSNHATAVAGVLAMRAGNDICGVGIAPLVTFSSLIMFDGFICTSNMGIMEGFNFYVDQQCDIIICPWSHTPNGKSTYYMANYIYAAFREGISKGRNGNGIIYVSPSGNGNAVPDNCSYDLCANIIYTITVGGSDYYGNASTAAERCSGILIAAYSGDSSLSKYLNLTTTSYSTGCSVGTTAGTSLCVSQIGGIVALMLEANPNLCWRSVQSVLVWTGEITVIAKNPGWKRNCAGLFFHPQLGFGLVNALAAVELVLALRSQKYPPMNSCVIRYQIKYGNFFKQPIKFGEKTSLKIRVKSNGCYNLPSAINYIEHVQLVITVTYNRRGRLEIMLTSPSGTQTQLLYRRSKDQSPDGFNMWVLDTTHLWAEHPSGEWIIHIFDSEHDNSQYNGELSYLTLIIHGSKEKPFLYSKPRMYIKFQKPKDEVKFQKPEDEAKFQMQETQQSKKKKTNIIKLLFRRIFG